MQRRVITGLLACVAMALLAGCGSKQEPEGASVSPTEGAAVKEGKVNASPKDQQLTLNPNYRGN